jgi:hypothetical protein
VGEWLQQRIIREVNTAIFFAVCAVDASKKEQLPLIFAIS